MPTITPFIWYDADLREVIDFYRGIFPDLEVMGDIPGPGGAIMGITIRLLGQELFLLNGGPEFPQTMAFSLYVRVEGQAEVDHYWEALLADGGTPSQCGWLQDRYGLAWQVVPAELERAVSQPDPERAEAARQAMYRMSKIVIADLPG